MDKELKKDFQKILISLEMKVNAYRNGESEKDLTLTDLTAVLLAIYAELNPDCHVGKFITAERELIAYDFHLQAEQEIHYDFAIPENDEELIRIIHEYNTKTGMSVEEKTYRLDSIKDRICELKGVLLYWSEEISEK